MCVRVHDLVDGTEDAELTRLIGWCTLQHHMPARMHARMLARVHARTHARTHALTHARSHLQSDNDEAKCSAIGPVPPSSSLSLCHSMSWLLCTLRSIADDKRPTYGAIRLF